MIFAIRVKKAVLILLEKIHVKLVFTALAIVKNMNVQPDNIPIREGKVLAHRVQPVRNVHQPVFHLVLELK